MENKGLKILIHASAFFAPYAVPILVYILCHFFKEDLELKKLAIQAIFFQLVLGALAIISILLIFIIIGIPLIIGLGLMWFIVPIIGIVKAQTTRSLTTQLLVHGLINIDKRVKMPSILVTSRCLFNWRYLCRIFKRHEYIYLLLRKVVILEFTN